MTSAPTDEELEQLNQLIPPPWPAKHRRRVAALVAITMTAVLAAPLAGLLGPQLAWGPDNGWETTGHIDSEVTARRYIEIHNDGWLPVTLHALDPPHVGGVEWGPISGVPAAIDPRGVHQISVSFTVTECDIDLGGFNALPLRASSGLVPARTIFLAPPHNDDPNTRTRTTADDGSQVTVPPWPDQPPSWMLDTIQAACTLLPDQVLNR